MSQKVSFEWIFTGLGLVFWLANRNLEASTLACVYYSLFVGLAWSLISAASREDGLTWKHVLSPFFLTVIMMVSGTLKVVASTEAVLITAIALIHVRAAIFSYNRFSGRALLFPSFQFFLFLYAMIYLFQKNILPFSIRPGMFWMSILILGSLSLMLLFLIRKKVHAEVASGNS